MVVALVSKGSSPESGLTFLCTHLNLPKAWKRNVNGTHLIYLLHFIFATWCYILYSDMHVYEKLNRHTIWVWDQFIWVTRWFDGVLSNSRSLMAFLCQWHLNHVFHIIVWLGYLGNWGWRELIRDVYLDACSDGVSLLCSELGWLRTLWRWVVSN